jgi:sterol desaturase/sphingolipid hydroxylase (fatty acid hydroxylase superfamily)
MALGLNNFILEHEPFIRFCFFFGILVFMATWELIAPRRPLTTSKASRWLSNLGIVALDTLVVRLILSTQAVGMALFVESHGWGLLNNVILPPWMKIILGVLGLDLVIYLQHAMFHALPLFWRLHRMHHTDLDYDVTTGIRFHPLEILLSMGIKMAAVALLGPSAVAVILFEVLLNATSMFNHGNVRLPKGIDRVLRLLVVTPEMHRVHHSVVIKEFNSNFGFNFPWWDRLMGTYQAQPMRGHEGMTIGLSQYRDPRRLTLPWLLIQPFFESGKYPADQRKDA